MIEKLFKFLAIFFNGEEVETYTAPKVTIKPVKKHSKKKKSSTTLTLVLERTWFTRRATIGELSIDDKFECYILEDFDRLSKGGKKIHGETAIPRGTYVIDITYSPRFKKKLPLLKRVPGFTGVRIHAGNTPEDTEGCLLPGLTKSTNFVGQSKRAFTKLYRKLERAKRDGKRIVIRIE